jgi:hypothetical protein
VTLHGGHSLPAVAPDRPVAGRVRRSVGPHSGGGAGRRRQSDLSGLLQCRPWARAGRTAAEYASWSASRRLSRTTRRGSGSSTAGTARRSGHSGHGFRVCRTTARGGGDDGPHSDAAWARCSLMRAWSISARSSGSAGDMECSGGACYDNCGPCKTCATLSGCVAKTCPDSRICRWDGQCVCPAGWDICSGECADLDNDPADCGQCGVVCGPLMSCVDGKCSCEPPNTMCGTECLNLNVDRQNCGKCGNVCLPPNQDCVAGKCTYSSFYCLPDPSICCENGQPKLYCAPGVMCLRAKTGELCCQGRPDGGCVP